MHSIGIVVKAMLINEGWHVCVGLRMLLPRILTNCPCFALPIFNIEGYFDSELPEEILWTLASKHNVCE
jgi:hypothetical protein